MSARHSLSVARFGAHRVLIQMASGKMAATDLFPHGLVGLTLGHRFGAAWMKPTASRGIERIGYLARQDHALSPQRRVQGERRR
jgi:hypothetical protein